MRCILRQLLLQEFLNSKLPFFHPNSSDFSDDNLISSLKSKNFLACLGLEVLMQNSFFKNQSKDIKFADSLVNGF